MDISIIIPVYNGSKIIPLLTSRLETVLPQVSDAYEVLFVNDGSPDNSWDVIVQLSRIHPWVCGINLMRNYGQHNALLAGIRAARYEIIATMDDDLQHPPEELPKMLLELEKGYDVVYGIPKQLPHSFWRNIFSKFTKSILAKVMGIQNIRDINAFRVFRTYLREAFANYQSPNLLLDVLLSWGTANFSTTIVNHQPREIGKSNYTFGKLVNQAMLVLTGFSTAPLRIASLIGFGAIIFGLIMLMYVIGVYIFLGSSPGFPFLASITIIFSGTELFSLGILGEYLARIFSRSMERPNYAVKDIINLTEEVE
jgi:glycosyltransferase involved in cell wall biosynthesis